MDKSIKSKLTLVAAIAFITASLKGFGAIVSLGMIAFGDAYYDFLSSMPGQTANTVAFNQSLNAITKEWAPISVPVSLASVVLGIVLLLGAVMLLRRRPAALKWLTFAFVAALIIDLGSLWVTFQTQTEVARVSHEFFLQQSEYGTEFERKVNTYAARSQYSGLIWSVGMILALMAFYVYCLRILRRDDVRAALLNPPPPA